MIYKFKSRATGDLIMLGPNGDELLRVIGREPSAKGIIEVEHMAQARRLIDEAVARAEAAGAAPRDERAEEDEAKADAVGLRQRLWPMRQMLEEAERAREAITWGV